MTIDDLYKYIETLKKDKQELEFKNNVLLADIQYYKAKIKKIESSIKELNDCLEENWWK